LAFLPDVLLVRDGERARTKLFGDLRVIPSAQAVEVSSDNPRIEVQLDPSWEAVTADVVRTRVVVVGRGKGEEGLLTAQAGAIEALAAVEVVSKKKRRPEGGHFKGYRFQEISGRKIQTTSDSEGFVIINLLDPTNCSYFGTTPAQATKSVEQRPASQTLLADLILDECLQQAVADAYNKGKLRQRFPTDPLTDIRSYIAEQRFEIGSEIHRLFTGSSIPRPSGA